MARWEFKALELNKDGTQKLVALSPDQQMRVPAYASFLEAARSSHVPNPRWSNYRVREGIGRLGEGAFQAGNIEYGYCKSLHGEPSASVIFRSARGNAFPAEGVGIVLPRSGEAAPPCGNCRDFMLDEFGKEFEIVSGSAEGGIAVVAELHQYLFENFFRLSLEYDFASGAILPELGMSPMALESKVWLTVREGKQLTYDSYAQSDPYPERRYAATVFTTRGYFAGGHDVMCDLDPTYALGDAIRQARRVGDSQFWCAVIVGEGSGERPPHVMYKDRQHLLELNIQAELTWDEEGNPPVLLATHQGDTITGLWKTSVKEWLPLPFSPYAFGPEFVEHLRKYFQSKASRL